MGSEGIVPVLRDCGCFLECHCVRFQLVGVYCARAGRGSVSLLDSLSRHGHHEAEAVDTDELITSCIDTDYPITVSQAFKSASS